MQAPSAGVDAPLIGVRGNPVIPCSSSVHRQAACLDGVCAQPPCQSLERTRRRAVKPLWTPQVRRRPLPRQPICRRRTTSSAVNALIRMPNNRMSARPPLSVPRPDRAHAERNLDVGAPAVIGFRRRRRVSVLGAALCRHTAWPSGADAIEPRASVTFMRQSSDPPHRHAGVLSAAASPSSRKRRPVLRTDARHSAARSPSCRHVTTRTGVPLR